MKAPIFIVLLCVVNLVSGQSKDGFSDTASLITNRFNKDLANILAITSQIPGGTCPTLNETDVKFLLYSRDNSNPIRLNPYNPVELEPGKKLIFVMHGWVSDPSSGGFNDLKDAYLERYDANIVIVDWSVSARHIYRLAVCYLEQIAKIMADTLCLLQQEHNISVNSIHLIGHSLGAQMAALISQRTLAMCNQKVGRITALDPAKPYYQGNPESNRLDKDDATFVDVIHTNAAILGYQGDCGDVDFYVNCGTYQPGCPKVDDLEKALDHPGPIVACNHFRSVQLMTESVNSPNFKGRLCSSCPSVCELNRLNSVEITMGEDCPRDASGPHVVYTNAEPPFGMGS